MSANAVLRLYFFQHSVPIIFKSLLRSWFHVGGWDPGRLCQDELKDPSLQRDWLRLPNLLTRSESNLMILHDQVLQSLLQRTFSSTVLATDSTLGLLRNSKLYDNLSRTASEGKLTSTYLDVLSPQLQLIIKTSLSQILTRSLPIFNPFQSPRNNPKCLKYPSSAPQHHLSPPSPQE